MLCIRHRGAGFATLVALLMLTLSATACRKDADAPNAEQTGDEAEAGLPVVVTQLERGDIASEIVASTTLDARSAVQVVSESVGIVRRLEAEVGETVEDGKLLAALHHAQTRLALTRATDLVARNERELARLEPLLADGFVSTSRIDELRFALDQSRRDVERAQEEVANLRIRATMTGTVVARHVDKGERVAPGTPLFDIADVEHLEAKVHVPERYLPRLAPGQEARITAEALAGATVGGQVERISPVVDARTGTVEVTVAVDVKAAVPEGSQAPRPGMFVTVRLVVDTHRDVLLAPKAAVVYEDGRPVFFTANEEGRAQRVSPSLGYDDGRRVEVAAGLTAEQKLIVQGQDDLKDGTPIRIVAQEGKPAAGLDPPQKATAQP